MINDAVDLRYDPERGPPQKLSFRPRGRGGWYLVTLEWTGCGWAEKSVEHVDELAIETADGAIVGQ